MSNRPEYTGVSDLLRENSAFNDAMEDLDSDVIPIGCFPEGTEDHSINYDWIHKTYTYVCSYKGKDFAYSVSKRVAEGTQISQLFAMIKLKFEYAIGSKTKKKGKLGALKERMLK